MAESDKSKRRPIGEKRLAAIMFTDVVMFSARVQEHESLTLRLLNRDLRFIRDLCRQCGGQVLKGTGDGLLISFDSAEAAVGCALRTQKSLSDAAAKLPQDQILEHRIGIHLGDVFITEDEDVLGNGVNVAARILQESEPGGICISQTVYDVVKHRLGVKAHFLGKRELKNIRDAIPVYRLLVRAEDYRAPIGPNPEIPRDAPTSAKRFKMPAIAILLLTLAVGAGLIASKIAMSWKSAQTSAPLPQSAPDPSPPPVPTTQIRSSAVTKIASADEMTPSPGMPRESAPARVDPPIAKLSGGIDTSVSTAPVEGPLATQPHPETPASSPPSDQPPDDPPSAPRPATLAEIVRSTPTQLYDFEPKTNRGFNRPLRSPLDAEAAEDGFKIRPVQHQVRAEVEKGCYRLTRDHPGSIYVDTPIQLKGDFALEVRGRRLSGRESGWQVELANGKRSSAPEFRISRELLCLQNSRTVNGKIRWNMQKPPLRPEGEFDCLQLLLRDHHLTAHLNGEQVFLEDFRFEPVAICLGAVTLGDKQGVEFDVIKLWTGSDLLTTIPMPAPGTKNEPDRRADLERQPAEPFSTFEGESLSSSAKASGGKVGTQNMLRFDGKWSGDAQLMWLDGTRGDILSIPLRVSREAKYDVMLTFTNAPDFAMVRVFMDGTLVSDSIDLYSPTVTRSSITLPPLQLAAKPHELRIEIIGKNPRSTKLFVGLDVIALHLTH